MAASSPRKMATPPADPLGSKGPGDAPLSPGERVRLSQWEAFRQEMAELEGRMAALAQEFLELKDYERAAHCASKAEGVRLACRRMPPAEPSKHVLP